MVEQYLNCISSPWKFVKVFWVRDLSLPVQFSSLHIHPFKLNKLMAIKQSIFPFLKMSFLTEFPKKHIRFQQMPYFNI